MALSEESKKLYHDTVKNTVIGVIKIANDLHNKNGKATIKVEGFELNDTPINMMHVYLILVRDRLFQYRMLSMLNGKEVQSMGLNSKYSNIMPTSSVNIANELLAIVDQVEDEVLTECHSNGLLRIEDYNKIGIKMVAMTCGNLSDNSIIELVSSYEQDKVAEFIGEAINSSSMITDSLSFYTNEKGDILN